MPTGATRRQLGRWRLEHNAQAAQTLGDALDWINDGTALIGPQGRILYCNTNFEKFASAGDGIGIDQDHIAFAGRRARAHFENALAALDRIRTGESGDGALVDFAATRLSRMPPYVVSVRPLMHRPRDRGTEAAIGIVFIRDPSMRNAAAIGLLRERFGLTPAESALAHALQSGISPAHYARENGLSPNTVYTHLRRIKDKTGLHRTAELSRKLNELRVPSRRD